MKTSLALLLGLTVGLSIARADLAAELNAPGDAPQLRGLGAGCHMGRMPNWDPDKVIPLLREMGVDYVRDSIIWQGVEKTKGVYEMPPEKARYLQALHDNNLKLILIFAFGNKLYENPLDPDAFANFAKWTVTNTPGQVAAYEIWNEPDNFFFYKQYGGKRDGSGKAVWNQKYSELVRKTAAAIKSVDPKITVLHNNEGKAWQHALEDFPQDYAQTDGVDLHPYPTNTPRDGVEGRHDELDEQSNAWPTKALGHPTQCWVGECGMSTWTPGPLAKVHFTPVTEPYQAACEVRSLVLGLTYGVKAWCIYDFVDESARADDVESNFGLVKDITRGYERKPAFFALKRLARLLGPDWQLIPSGDLKATLSAKLPPPPVPAAGSRKPSLTGPLAYWFKVGPDIVTLVWKAGGEAHPDAPPALGKITWPDAPAGTTAEAVDLVTGQAVPVKLAPGAKGGVTLSGVPVGWAPVAIRWKASSR